MMAVRQHQRTADGVTSAVATWYECATNGDTAVIALPVSPTLWLVHRPDAQVYWWTAGRKGLTVSLEDARQRLTMVADPRRTTGGCGGAPAEGAVTTGRR